MVKIEFTPLSLDRKIFPFKKGFKKQWESEWGGKIFFSHGKSNSTGVAILTKNIIRDTEPDYVERDTVGRSILVDIKIEEHVLDLLTFTGLTRMILHS